MTPREVQRFDYAELPSGIEITAAGALRLNATLTRTGVFRYELPDGTVRRELRLAPDVFEADSLATLRGVTVTRDHPPELLVTPATWRARAIGHTEDPVQQDARLLGATLVIQDEAAIRAIRDRELVEVSCGYRCTLEETSGVTADGEPYDAVQRRIRHNHVALGPRGWARAGPEARLHIDSARDALECAHQQVNTDAGGTGMGGRHMPDIRLTRVNIDGADCEIAEHHATHATAAVARIIKRATDAEDRAQSLQKERDALQAKLDAAEEQLEEAKAASSPEAQAERTRARVALEQLAAEVLGADVDVSAMSDREIMEACIAKTSPKTDAAALRQKSVEYVQARFDAMREQLAARADGGRQDRRAAIETLDRGRGSRSDGAGGESRVKRAVRADAARMRGEVPAGAEGRS